MLLRRINLSSIKTLAMTRLVVNYIKNNIKLNSQNEAITSKILGTRNAYNFSSSYSNKPPVS